METRFFSLLVFLFPFCSCSSSASSTDSSFHNQCCSTWFLTPFAGSSFSALLCTPAATASTATVTAVNFQNYISEPGLSPELRAHPANFPREYLCLGAPNTLQIYHSKIELNSCLLMFFSYLPPLTQHQCHSPSHVKEFQVSYVRNLFPLMVSHFTFYKDAL